MGDAPTVAAVSPKLLELGKEDVNAARSFLPGKILGRTALLALGVVCLRFHELFNIGIGQFIGFQLEPRWLKNTLLFGIPVSSLNHRNCQGFLSPGKPGRFAGTGWWS